MMERVFRSDRFMTLETYEHSATADGQTSVFTLGRTMTIFLGDGTLDRLHFSEMMPSTT